MPSAGDQAKTPAAQPKRSLLRRPRVLILIALILAVGAYFGIRHIRHARMYQSTDDAFVEAHVVSVSPRIASYVARVLTDDNRHVKRGQLLVELDPRDYQARLNQARANRAAAAAGHTAASINVRVVAKTSGANIRQAEAAILAAEGVAQAARSQIGAAQADRVAAEAEATRASADVERYQRLLTTSAVSRQQTDAAVAANRTAKARLEAARRAEQTATATWRQAQGQIAEAQARLAEARAAPDQVAYSRAQAEQAAAQTKQLDEAVRLAELEYSYTKIYAPASGRITRKSVEPGDYLQPGQRIFSIVPDEVWIVANFKETQLRHIRKGQPATVKIDAYPDKVFRGHVESVQAGSGAAFSLLPPENATGNYVKVVQRVPVKIVLDEIPDSSHVLGPGMSAVPTIKVR